MLKNIIGLIEKDIDDVCVRKLIINAISGYMGKTHSSHVKAIVDTDDNTLWNSFIKFLQTNSTPLSLAYCRMVFEYQLFL